MLYIRNIAKFFVPVLLLFTLCFLANATVNQHYHRLSSGIIVSHAHTVPKGNNNTPSGEHNHTSSEFIFLDQAYNTIFWIYLFYLLLAVIAPLIREKYDTFNTKSGKSYRYYLLNYHAPPANS